MPSRIGRRGFLTAGGVAAAALLAPGTALAEPAVPPRVVPVDGSLNARDVGGHRTRQGTTVRYGRMVRSGTLSGVTETGLAQLAALRLHTIVDYRDATEIARSGPGRVPPRVRVVELPVGAAEPVLNGLLPARPDPALIATYRSYTSHPESLGQFAATFRLLANPTALPLLVTDATGTGRVGWMTALLLTLLGVPRDAVYAEYLYSNAQLGGPHVAKEYLDAAFDQAVAQFGSLDAFYTLGLGVTPLVRGLIYLNFLGPGH
ncbi:tyrosine-protein phosphatase [Pseudonocardia sp. CA-107938]|uniref:tyrosine-protein phosphatase n=1 Tax=Pseudonocardia sp. CA-107938 TaxID=3240021 RepID=UPI003D8F6670